MLKGFVSKLLVSPVLHIMVVFALVVLIRGAEGLGERVSLDINDSILFHQIAISHELPAESIARQFASAIIGLGTTFWPNIALHALGLSPEQQYLVLYVVQMMMLAGGLLYFFRAFDHHFAYVLLAVLLALMSGFTGFGRYLVLGGAFKVVTSTFAMTIGFLVLGLYIRGRDVFAAAAAALLASYHPSHGMVLLMIIYGNAVWSFLHGRVQTRELYRMAAATAVCLLPFWVFVVTKLPPDQAYDPSGWWAYVFSKTSNLTPLQDGALVVAAIIGTLALGAVAAQGELTQRSEALNDTMRRMQALVCVVILLWTVQVFASEVLRSVALTQLALTRATPYAVLALVAVFAEKLFRALRGSDVMERAAALTLVVALLGMVARPTNNLSKLLSDINLPLQSLTWLNHPVVLKHMSLLLLTAVLAWWCWLPQMTTSWRRRMTVLVVVSILIFALAFGLHLPLPIFAAAVTVFLLCRPQIVRRLWVSTAWAIAMVFVLAIVIFFERNPWRRSNTEQHTRMIEMVEAHVPLGAMILTIPVGDLAADHLLPIRATFMGWSEGQYLIYLPQLESQVGERLKLLGVHPVANSTECADWLLRPMCRRQLYRENAFEYDDAWRGRLEQMRYLAPSLTHALIRDSYLCKSDRPTERIDGLTLVALEDVAPPGCQRAGK